MREQRGSATTSAGSTEYETSAVSRQIENYVEAWWLRAPLTLVPVAGPILDALLTSAAATLTRRRLEHFAEELIKTGERIKEQVDVRALQSEQWHDLALRSFAAAARTRDSERRTMYAAILLGTASPLWPDDLDSEATLDALSELTAVEVGALRTLYAAYEQPQQNDLTSWKPFFEAWTAAEEQLPPDIKRNLTFVLKRLERVGFISEITGTIYDYRGGSYRFTPTFLRLMSALERLGAP